jgi:hypothetical protein
MTAEAIKHLSLSTNLVLEAFSLHPEATIKKCDKQQQWWFLNYAAVKYREVKNRAKHWQPTAYYQFNSLPFIASHLRQRKMFLISLVHDRTFGSIPRNCPLCAP